jgi:hypothetical protein
MAEVSTEFTIETTPFSWQRYYLIGPPPFNGVEVGPFKTLTEAFAYARARDIPFDEAVAAQMIAHAESPA